jgi:hypothetical protein
MPTAPRFFLPKMNSDELLSTIETCERAAYWSLDWERSRITANQLLQDGIRSGLLSKRKDFGQESGETVIGLARDRELILEDKTDQYTSIIHHAALADILTHALRKAVEEPWKELGDTTIPGGRKWTPSVLLSPSGHSLRRIVLVSNWSKERHFSFCRSWETIGNVCAYSMPMQLAVCVLGQMKDGRRQGYFSKAYSHPVNHGVRFRRKNFIAQGFKSSWKPIFREDYDNISTADWLQAMHTDEVLDDSCFSVTVEVPQEDMRKHILELASRKLDRIEQEKSLPDEKLTGCFWPVKCPFISPCHSGEQPSGRFGFVRISDIVDHR